MAWPRPQIGGLFLSYPIYRIIKKVTTDSNGDADYTKTFNAPHILGNVIAYATLKCIEFFNLYVSLLNPNDEEISGSLVAEPGGEIGKFGASGSPGPSSTILSGTKIEDGQKVKVSIRGGEAATEHKIVMIVQRVRK